MRYSNALSILLELIRELEGEDEDLQPRCPNSTTVWRNGVGADVNGVEEIRFVRNEDAEEYKMGEMGRL